MRTFLILAIGLAAILGAQAQTPAPPPSCESEAGFHKLDFWVGEWDVFVAKEKVGDNRIEKILDGCAIVENWRDAEGREGKSFFYYLPASGKWKQVWVTQRATATGGVKEKALVEEFRDGAVRFQGEIARRDGTTYLDRTTLTPSPDGSVRQVIEISSDGGRSWKTTFDARYVKKR